jgi:phenylalanyl-tRNA synthetase beta chain
MAIELAGGAPSEAVFAGRPPLEPRTVSYRPGRCAELGGLDVAEPRQREILERLGFGVALGESWTISVPSWRRDVIGSADIVEEVARIEGYDKVPSTPLRRAPGVARPTATAEQLTERKVRRTAAARGLDEAVTWSFISEAEAAPFGGAAWLLDNPISEEMKAMRPSLLPGLLSAAARNMARGATSVRLFEVGRRYLADAERATLGLVLGGERRDRHWRSGRAESFDAFDAKIEVLAILGACGAPVESLQVLSPASAVYHPGRSARFGLGPNTVLAEFGELHPTILQAFDLEGPMVAAEIFLDALPQRRGTAGRMRAAFTPPALQSVRRDFAFLVPSDLEAGRVLRAVRAADRQAISAVELFDVFTGRGVPEGRKSLAVEVTLQPADKSFTEEELKAISDRIVAAAARLGATLRS